MNEEGRPGAAPTPEGDEAGAGRDAADAGRGEPGPETGARIVVALDASPQSIAALRAAVELAQRLQAEIEGLFVEDINLFCLCDLPFGREVCGCTGEVRGVDAEGMERQMRVQAASIRREMEVVASTTSVPWTLRVLRGSVVEELQTAAQGASLMSVGRAGRASRTGIGSIAQELVDEARRPLLVSGEGSGLQYPLTVLYTGTPEAERALELAIRLSGGEPERLRVLAWPRGDPGQDAGVLMRQARRRLEAEPPATERPVTILRVDEPAHLPAVLHELHGGTLVLPRAHAELIARYRGPSLLVP